MPASRAVRFFGKDLMMGMAVGTIVRVHVASWIIQDGNYDDFVVGDRYRFALEFWPENGALAPIDPDGDLSCVSAGEDGYEVYAKVVHCTEEWWAIDFGLRAFTERSPPAWSTVGGCVAGGIRLGIDPYFYKEYLHCESGAPALSYQWQLERLQIQTAPFIPDPTGKHCLVRDETKLGWRDIGRTDAWEDDDRNAEYLMDCRRLSDKPTRE